MCVCVQSQAEPAIAHQAKPTVKPGYLGKELLEASKKGDSNKVKELLDAGADPNSRNAVSRRT